MDLREKIIRESIRLFSLNGFLGASLNDIIEAAGTSKGGFYNHFKTKEALFSAVLSESRKIWREKTLAGLERLDQPLEKIFKFLENYRDRYLKDNENFPGGCLFIALAVELDHRRPALAREVHEGFARLKNMIHRLLDQAQAEGQLKDQVNTAALTEMIFAGMLGASVMYGLDQSPEGLDRTINALITHLRSLAGQGFDFGQGLI